MRSLRIAGLALEGLRRTPLRVTLTTLGVSIASAALVSLVAFALGVQQQVERPFRSLGLLNHIQVSSSGEAEEVSGPPLDDAALKRLSEIRGVVAVYPDIRVHGIQLRRGEKIESVLAMGIPREIAWFGVEQDLIVAGRFFGEEDQREAVIGTQLLRGLGFRTPQEALGQVVTLEAAGMTPESGKTFTFEKKAVSVTIVGVYRAPPIMPSPAHRALLLPIELMKELPGTQFDAAVSRLKAGAEAAPGTYASATVRVGEPVDVPSVESHVREMGFHTRSMLSRLQGMRIFFVVLEMLLAAMGTVALVIAALGIVNTLLMSVLERYQEIGIYKAIGASAGDLFVLFVTEAGIIGALGGFCGLGLGWLVSWGLEAAANVSARRWEIVDHIDLFAFPWWLLAGTVLFSMLVSLLAGVYPAMRAARIDPIRALRRE